MIVADKEKVRKAVEAIKEGMISIAAIRKANKELIDTLAEETEMDKKLIRKLAKTLYDNSFEDVVAEADEFETVYNNVIGQE